ncbi:MAG: F0F1 ATP synthase subunit A [Flavobacteriales bacterium]|nr:F0F1 ATP synthase subunit A [Flavobacteriales bacterium]
MSGYTTKKLLLFILVTLVALGLKAQNHDTQTEEKIDQTAFIMGHIRDSHTFHICDVDGHAVGVSLPVILISHGKLITFMSGDFHHDNTGSHVVEKDGQSFVLYFDGFNEKIYQASSTPNEDGTYLSRDEQGKVISYTPLDFSITKNVVTLIMVVLSMLAIFITMGSFYRKKENVEKAPRGIASMFEPLVVYVRDEIALPNIGEEYYKKYTPYLLTLFFFVLFTNLFGLIPFFPFGANISGNTSFSFALAFLTFVIVQFSGTKAYWKEIISMPGVPKPVMLILAPVEFLGLFTKPFALTIRLFAAIMGGHIIILSLLLLIFMFKMWAVVPASGVFIMFMYLIEILVAVIQAYIFTLLTALYIGMAKLEEHEEH